MHRLQVVITYSSGGWKTMQTLIRHISCVSNFIFLCYALFYCPDHFLFHPPQVGGDNVLIAVCL